MAFKVMGIAAGRKNSNSEFLLKEALLLDGGEVETVAHYYAARFFDPEVDCILDIGGQDMKYMRIKDGVIDSVLLNEACSSGCGSSHNLYSCIPGVPFPVFPHGILQPRPAGKRCPPFPGYSLRPDTVPSAHLLPAE